MTSITSNYHDQPSVRATLQLFAYWYPEEYLRTGSQIFLVSFRSFLMYAVRFLSQFGIPYRGCHKSKLEAISSGCVMQWSGCLVLLARHFWKTFGKLP